MHIDESKKFDRRTIERNLKEGIISPKEWESYLRALPDVSDNVDYVTMEGERKKEIIEEQEEEPKEPVEKEPTPENE